MNNKTVALSDETVAEGDMVVLNPRDHMDLFDFSAFALGMYGPYLALPNDLQDASSERVLQEFSNSRSGSRSWHIALDLLRLTSTRPRTSAG